MFWKPRPAFLNTLRVRAFPFPESVRQFVLSHERVFLIEQNRDAQLHNLVINEFDLDPARIIAICTTTAPRSPPASSPVPSPNTCAAPVSTHANASSKWHDQQVAGNPIQRALKPAVIPAQAELRRQDAEANIRDAGNDRRT